MFLEAVFVCVEGDRGHPGGKKRLESERAFTLCGGAAVSRGQDRRGPTQTAVSSRLDDRGRLRAEQRDARCWWPQATSGVRGEALP